MPATQSTTQPHKSARSPARCHWRCQ
jgi:hypothetical protein